MDKEQKFYSALKDIFVGARIEGESGYINLMKIKSRYYQKGILPKLQVDIEEALKPFPAPFREELFDKLYTFFSRYFSRSGSIYFSNTPIHQSVYERVYTDDRDVILFWKTHPLYYVKTDRLFKSLEVEIDGFKFFFDSSKLEHKKAFEKKEIVYELRGMEDKRIVFDVQYSEKGRITKLDDILRALKKEGIRITEETLEKAFRVFERQSEVDYFINQNTRDFLREQFNLWFYQYVFSGESEWTEKRIKELQTLKDISFKVIDFISQFENELVKIWNKPKFVLNSNYVITLDRIVAALSGKGIELIERILSHPNFTQQVSEWKDMGIVDDTFSPSAILSATLPVIASEAKQSLNPKYKHLPLDTKYFKDLELEILRLFDDLDNALDGWLIKSENYQALNTILPKFREKVQTIYIDPPFNKEQDADYFYSVKYKDSSWITLLENRLQLAKDILKDTGSIFVRCDYNGNMYVRLLMNEIFGEENFRNEIAISRRKFQMIGGETFSTRTETLWLYSRSQNLQFNKIRRKIPNPVWKPLLHLPGDREKPERFVEAVRILPPPGRHFGISQESLDVAYKEGRVRFNEKGQVEIFVDTEELNNNWTEIDGYAFSWDFPTENSEILLKRVIESTSNEGDIVMDFFLGIGTTTAVAHKLKRKWIGMEMGDHFYSFKSEKGRLSGVLVRMKEVLAGRGNHEPCGISKEVKQQGGGFFKYYELEQYEDALRRVKYEDSDLFDTPYQDPYSQYVFMKDLKMLDALQVDYENNKVKVDLGKLYQGIDIPETLSNLLGKGIKRVTAKEVEFENGERIDIGDLDYKLIKPLIWW